MVNIFIFDSRTISNGFAFGSASRKWTTSLPYTTKCNAKSSYTTSYNFARTLLYAEVPKHYTWQPSKCFQRCKQGKPVEGYPNVFSTDAIGRIYTVHPSNDECFYLRLLLVNVRGPTSFQNLRTPFTVCKSSLH